MSMWETVSEQLNDEDEEGDQLEILSSPEKLRHNLSFDDVLHLLTTCKKIVVLTGAGVSVSCGIPDFRSENGVYARLRKDFPTLPNPQAMFDLSYFCKNPRPFFKFAREIYPGQFKPSTSHHFIRELEKRNQLLRNYTQNIDTLEYACGLQRVIACHGGFSTATCTNCGYKMNCEALRADIFAQRIPLCVKCPQPEVQPWEVPCEDSPISETTIAVMKPDIVFFGEGLCEDYYQSVSRDRSDADLLIVMGSSLLVHPVATIPQLINHTVPQILINREALPHVTSFDIQLLGDCDVIIRELCSRLDAWKNETWLTNDKPPEEPDHPYTMVDLPQDENVPKLQPFIYKVKDDTYAFSGANLFPHVISSEDEASSSDEFSDTPESVSDNSQLIETVVDTLITKVADYNLEEST